ncbi:RecX family transcriptional regulator [Bacillus horti]|uniref:Regulatory protein RecX n=2 Tax=Caldalkalibacillus horti TaxID=77523 RepID=A0ABT9VUX8_9BACI|nr:regulatory protein [Bacillus horti]
MEQEHNPKQTGTISKIEVQKKNKQRYNIYIDGDYAFAVHEDILISQRLQKGKEITASELDVITAEEQYKKAERAAYHYLSYRPRTRKEIKDSLLRKDVEAGIVEQILDKLETEGYINDLDFALRWVSERIQLKLKGPLVLKEELRQKGISSRDIAEALGQLEYEEQVDACMRLAEKKWDQVKKRYTEKREQKHKLMMYLQRRGFSFEVIQPVIQRLEES